MSQADKAAFVSSIVALAAIGLLTLPALNRFFKRLSAGKSVQYTELPEKYEDDDGIATEASQAAFSVRFQNLFLSIFAIVGTLVSLITAVLATQRQQVQLSTEQWLSFASWILLSFQVLSTSTEPFCTRKYGLSVYGALSSLLFFIAVIIENLTFWSGPTVYELHNIHLALVLVSSLDLLLLLVIFVSIPRRPNVYKEEKLVDRQHTVSLLSKLTFSWCGHLLSQARTEKGLELEDLCKVDHRTRAENLTRKFEEAKGAKKLWRTIVWANRYGLGLQLGLVLIVSVINFAPQVALLLILRTLERRDRGYRVAAEAWTWVVFLGIAMLFAGWVESWLHWICFSKVGIPIYEQLSAVIFGKSMRRKDIKSTGKKSAPTNTDENTLINKDAGPNDEDRAPQKEEEADDETAKTRQSTINLVGVDSKRVSDFSIFAQIFPGSAVRLICAGILLIYLVGWVPLVIGLAVPILVTPLNIFASKRYAKAQDDLMKVRDQKMALVTEALQGIRQIKFSALEEQWHNRVMDIRLKELRTQWRVFRFDTTLIGIWILSPVLLAAVTLAVYAIIHRELTASVAFTTLSVFEAIEMTLSVIPELTTDFLDAKISVERIEKYLNSPEVEQTISSGSTVDFKDATITWPSDGDEDDNTRFELRNLNISFPKKELSVISGRTGSGKSLMLASIIGEADLKEGSITAPRPPPQHERYDAQATKRDWTIEGAIAFVAQIPWIENATIKDNILFGLPCLEDRYKKVIQACALEKDLEMLPDGELTDIGANGINLSGGQKWRVSFARALYSRASILVLDDIFSAVDAHVGRHLFEEALTGELGRGRTRILVTHHVALCLPKTKYSVLLADGTAQYAGNVDELQKTGDLKAILEQDIEMIDESSDDTAVEDSEVDPNTGLERIATNRSTRSRRKSVVIDPENEAKAAIVAPKKFTEEEKKFRGAIKGAVYKAYLSASGGLFYWAFLWVVFTLNIIIFLARTYWVSLWTRSYDTEQQDQLKVSFSRASTYSLQHFIPPRNDSAAVSMDSPGSGSSLWFYLGLYVGISVIACIIGASKYFFCFLASIRASKKLFQNLTFAVLRAQLRWLDTVPLGRILNRFTADFNLLDSRIAMDFGFFLNNAMNVLAIFAAGIFISPLMLLFALIVLVICMYIALYYLAGAREAKRLDSNAKSPVFEQFGSALTGLATIRAFDKANTYIERQHTKINRQAQTMWHLWLFNRWLGFRLNALGAIFATLTAALIVGIKGIDASLAGFALSFALQYTDALTWALRQYANVELDMNATERIVEYSKVEIESQGGHNPPAAWPTEGKLEVKDLVVGYAADLPPVLKGLSFDVAKNERVGVVGRTGAGKSSLTLALFRFLEAREGSIHVDGLNIADITLHDLRSRLAIIPQDPVLFSGTVRSNLDAFDQHTDDELKDALERVHLISSSSSTSSPVKPTHEPSSSAEASGSITPVNPTNRAITLSTKISEGGLNLSQGQRQLLCLARAIVSRPKIMVLDEATSAVDMETDALIQRSIREEFGDATLIVIAHRLSTIADFDRILVMGEGQVKEYDRPNRLMEIEDGVFRGMVEESGERDELEGVIRRAAEDGNK